VSNVGPISAGGALVTEIFISHSSQAGPQVAAFLETLPGALRARGLQPFLDSTGLRAGYEWRPVLYRKLAECGGAVLALGPEALQRDWVRQEATILAWRRALRAYAGRTMPVVAALLDGLTRKQLVDAFPALNLGETELVRPASGSAEAAVTAAQQIAAIFPEAHDSDDDPMQWWTARVAAWLRPVDEEFLGRVGGMFDIAPDDWDPRARSYTLADALLHAEAFERVEAALEEIVESGVSHARLVVEKVLPVAVSARTAQVLLAAMREPEGERVTALNTSFPELGELFVQRATCCDRGVLVVCSPVQLSGDEDALYAEVLAMIGEKAGARPPASFRPEQMRFVKNKNFVLVLQRSDADRQGLPLTVLRTLLARLKVDFPACTFVVLSGPRYAADLDDLVPARLRADPPLDEEEQQVRYLAVNRLREQARRASTA
jgi:hypothetical protein